MPTARYLAARVILPLAIAAAFVAISVIPAISAPAAGAAQDAVYDDALRARVDDRSRCTPALAMLLGARLRTAVN